MTTPTRQPVGAPLQNLVSSSSFLQQLLEEINGTSTATVSHRRIIPHDTTYDTPPSLPASRRPSVWLGGSMIAQDARDKLRAADERRQLISSVSSQDTTLPLPTPTLPLRTPCFEPPSSSSILSTTNVSSCNPASSSPRASERDTHSILPDVTQSTCSRPIAGGLRLLVPPIHTIETLSPSDIARLDSPLMFYDIDSDLSSTPSSTELPTSAISATLTDASTVSEGRITWPRESGSRSPDKRLRSGSATPEMIPKKVRTMTLPAIPGHPEVPLMTQSASWRRSISGDNTSLVGDSSFTERGLAVVEHLRPIDTSTQPELSSFRPRPAGPQGVPHGPTTPIRATPRRSSAAERDQIAGQADTPVYARSLHLIDSYVSVYKKDHGDEWREHTLCLYCFRRHGGFNKLREHGYEVCGRDEALESHYWESNCDPNCDDGDW